MSELLSAIKQVCDEKKIEYDLVISAIESSLAAAYRKDYGNKLQNIKVKFNPETGKSKIHDVKIVVEDLTEEEQREIDEIEEKKKAGLEKGESERKNFKKEEFRKEEGPESEEETERKFNPKTDIQLKDALLIKKDAKIGEEIVFDLEEPEGYGRMAAQTAKQVIIQKIREIEKETIFNEFKDQEGEVINGVIQRVEGRLVFIDLDKSIGILPMDEQIPGERYNVGGRIKVYIKEVRSGIRGAEIILSRKSEEIVKKIFTMEIPELANGLVEIKAVAREAGSRSKIAIYTDSENIDPVGSCVGQRGIRIQTIINELGGEKVDIIEYNDDPAKFISNALAPAKIMGIDIDEQNKKAIVKVSEDKLSLAIGKSGQNVRLAARLTGWKIDIISSGQEAEIIKFEEVANDADSIEIEKIDIDNSSKSSELVAEVEKTKEEKVKKTRKKEEKKLEEKKGEKKVKKTSKK
ncbi:MAG: transcription termination factor NusA [Patescibacteria group bacterium]|nr:transcription termination factor NusA [Patescibacteria group bacterium]